MDRRMSVAIAGAAVVGAVLWLTMRRGETEALASHDAVPGGEATGDVTATSATTASSTTPAISATSATSPTNAPPARAKDQSPIPATHAASPDASPADRASPSLPIDVSPGFEMLSTPASEMKDTDGDWSLWRRHQQLQSESRDEAWAPRIESALREGLQQNMLARGFTTERFELPVVECRTNACEIQAVGHVQDSRSGGVDFQQIMGTVMMSALGSEFEQDGYIMRMGSRPDGRMTFLAHLPRKKR
jgi:hypothetical protein